MSENTENTETTSLEKEGVQPQNGQPQAEAQKNVLLGTISYSDEAAYEQFLQKMDVNQAVFVLIAATNFAQSKGAYLTQESELIAVATRAIKKSATASKPADVPVQPEK